MNNDKKDLPVLSDGSVPGVTGADGDPYACTLQAAQHNIALGASCDAMAREAVENAGVRVPDSGLIGAPEDPAVFGGGDGSIYRPLYKNGGLI